MHIVIVNGYFQNPLLHLQEVDSIDACLNNFITCAVIQSDAPALCEPLAHMHAGKHHYGRAGAMANH